MSERFAWIYKFDALTPDRDYSADYYTRHGFGLRWCFGPGAYVQVRTEVAFATPPSEAAKTSWSAENASFAMLELEL